MPTEKATLSPQSPPRLFPGGGGGGGGGGIKKEKKSRSKQTRPFTSKVAKLLKVGVTLNTTLQILIIFMVM